MSRFSSKLVLIPVGDMTTGAEQSRCLPLYVIILVQMQFSIETDLWVLWFSGY